MNYIKEKFVGPSQSIQDVLTHYKDKLMYMDVIDAYGCAAGCAAPDSARQRNLLNIMALLECNQPLATTPAIVDKGQQIGRTSLRVDGTVPTLATNAEMWSFPDGRLLSIAELAKMMGHDISQYDLSGTTQTAFRAMLGNSIHVGTLGLAMVCLFATLGSDP